MSGKQRLSTELDRFEKIIADLAMLSQRTDSARLNELIALRRQLSQQIGSMREAGPGAFTSPDVSNEFRSRLSAILKTVSMHQANWPAVMIDEGQAAYRQSALAAASANREFVDWTRAALKRDGH